MNRRMPSLSVHHQLKLMSIESVMPSSHLILCRPLLLLPPIPPSIRVFSNESTLCMRWPKYWSFPSASVLPVNTQDCFPLGWTVWISLQSKGLSESSPTPQFKSINSSALSFLYSPTLMSIHDYWKIHSLTTWNFVGKVMSLLFNMLSKLVIAFLPRKVSFNFMASITICSDFGAQKNKVSHCFPFPHLFATK